jgi:hypothetical protein
MATSPSPQERALMQVIRAIYEGTEDKTDVETSTAAFGMLMFSLGVTVTLLNRATAVHIVETETKAMQQETGIDKQLLTEGLADLAMLVIEGLKE